MSQRLYWHFGPGMNQPGMIQMVHVGPGINQMLHFGPGMNQLLHFGPGMNQMLHFGPGLNQMLHFGPGLNQMLHFGPGMNKMLHFGPGMNQMLLFGPGMNQMLHFDPGMNQMLHFGQGIPEHTSNFIFYNYCQFVIFSIKLGVLLPELVSCLVLIQTQAPMLLHAASVAPQLHVLLDHLDKFNRYAPGLERDDAEDLSWPGIGCKSFSIKSCYLSV